jgi:DedD protein
MRFFRLKSSAEQIPSLPSLSPEQQTQRRARHRLFGMLLLVVVTLVAVPWVLDQTPRPVPADLLIDMPIPQVKTAKPTKPMKAAKSANGEGEKTAEKPGLSDTEADAYLTEANHSTQTNAANKSNESALKGGVAAIPSAAMTVSQVDMESQPKQLKRLGLVPVPAQNVGYVLQLGAFGEGIKAKALRHKLAQAGFKSSLQTVMQTDGTRLLRVRVGPIETKERAKEMASQLEKRGFSPVLLPF